MDTSKIMEIHTKISDAHEVLGILMIDLACATEDFLNAAKAEGWEVFRLKSSYCGSKVSKDFEVIYLFKKEVWSPQWSEKVFGHGDKGRHEEWNKFEEWLTTLPKGSYLKVP